MASRSSPRPKAAARCATSRDPARSGERRPDRSEMDARSANEVIASSTAVSVGAASGKPLRTERIDSVLARSLVVAVRSACSNHASSGGVSTSTTTSFARADRSGQRGTWRLPLLVPNRPRHLSSSTTCGWRSVPPLRVADRHRHRPAGLLNPSRSTTRGGRGLRPRALRGLAGMAGNLPGGVGVGTADGVCPPGREDAVGLSRDRSRVGRRRLRNPPPVETGHRIPGPGGRTSHAPDGARPDVTADEQPRRVAPCGVTEAEPA